MSGDEKIARVMELLSQSIRSETPALDLLSEAYLLLGMEIRRRADARKPVDVRFGMEPLKKAQ